MVAESPIFISRKTKVIEIFRQYPGSLRKPIVGLPANLL